MDWLVLQLADSAFPSGGFAHSAGLEAAAQLGHVHGAAALEAYVHDAVWQAGHGSLPLVGAAHRHPAHAVRLDALCDAFLTSEVANRASRTQGRAFVVACARSFGGEEIEGLDAAVRDRRLRGHHAPLFGTAAAALGVGRTDALAVWMHGTLRGVLSAAVRLGLAGAHEAQALQRATGPLLDRVLAECGELDGAAIVQTAPRLEITGSQHARLYSRLFQS